MPRVERRIGLLFAGFLVLLGIAAGRAGYMAVVKGSGLASAASSQQVAEQKVPARRGTIVDRHGAPLAISEPADDVSATPVPRSRTPSRRPGASRRSSARDENALAKQLARRDTGFVYLARRLPAGRRPTASSSSTSRAST